MNYTILIVAGAILNLAIGFALLFFLLKNSAAIKKLSGDRDNHMDHYLSDLLERMQRIENNHPVQAIAEFNSRFREQPGSGINRVKEIIDNIRSGQDPDLARKEHGYSRSEMGLLLASAGLTGGSAEHI